MLEIQSNINTQELEKKFEELARKGKDLTPVMAEVANLIESSIEEAFEYEEDPVTGTPWEALSPVTVASKEKKGYADPNRPLYGDGTMQQSLNSTSTSYSATVGLNAKSNKGFPYPAVHQTGTEDGRVPARRFLPIDDDGNLARHVEEEILDILTVYFGA